VEKRGGGVGQINTDHINQTIQRSLVIFHQLRSIMLLPLLLILLAEVAFERLLAPRAVDRVCDGCDGGNGFVFTGVFEEL